MRATTGTKLGESLRRALEDLCTLLCEFVPRPIEDLVGDFNEYAIFVDGWWPGTFKTKAQVPSRNKIALVAGRIGGVIFAKHLLTLATGGAVHSPRMC